MAQYKVGTVTVTNGSATVTGSGTAWVANVPVGSYFVVAGDVVAYQVSSRTNTQITLTAPYGGSSGSGRSYVAHVDFHSNGAPSFLDDDIESAAILNRWLVQSWPAAAFGTAATRNVMTSLTDTTTPDALMPRGAFGVGGQTTDQDANSTGLPTRFFRSPSSAMPYSGFAHIIHMSRAMNAQSAQIAVRDSVSEPRMHFRPRGSNGVWADWQELYHTGNLGESDTAWTTVTSLQNGWTGTVRYIKRGGMVTVTVIEANGTNKTGDALLTLPVGYRPAVEVRSVAISGSSSDSAASRVSVLTGGSLALTGSINFLNGSITYPVIP